jgi:hypothetical protein
MCNAMPDTPTDKVVAAKASATWSLPETVSTEETTTPPTPGLSWDRTQAATSVG